MSEGTSCCRDGGIQVDMGLLGLCGKVHLADGPALGVVYNLAGDKDKSGAFSDGVLSRRDFRHLFVGGVIANMDGIDDEENEEFTVSTTQPLRPAGSRPGTGAERLFET